MNQSNCSFEKYCAVIGVQKSLVFVQLFVIKLISPTLSIRPSNSIRPSTVVAVAEYAVYEEWDLCNESSALYLFGRCAYSGKILNPGMRF